MKLVCVFLGLLVAAGCGAEAPSADVAAAVEWPSYGNDPGGMRYSPMADVNRAHVTRLRVAWTFHTGDMSDGQGGQPRSVRGPS